MFWKTAAALATSALTLGLSHPAFADLGPKPTMHFDFTFDHKDLTIAEGILLQCTKVDCSDATPLGRMGPQNFYCTNTSCGARAYGFSKFSMIEITFSDGRVLRSNIFSGQPFNAIFGVSIKGSGLVAALVK